MPLTIGTRLAAYEIVAPLRLDMPDGKRYVVVAQPGGPGGPTSPQIHVVLNWLEELKARVPTR